MRLSNLLIKQKNYDLLQSNVRMLLVTDTRGFLKALMRLRLLADLLPTLWGENSLVETPSTFRFMLVLYAALFILQCFNNAHELKRA